MAVAQFASIKQEPPDPESLAPDVPLLHTQSSEPVDPVDLEERILALCRDNPKGITDEMLTQDQPLIGTAKRMKALQRLLSQVRFVCGCLSHKPNFLVCGVRGL